MKPYKGQVEIACKREKGGCLKNLHKDVAPGCMDCPESVTRILDLSGEVLFEYHSPEEKTGTSGRLIKKVITPAVEETHDGEDEQA